MGLSERKFWRLTLREYDAQLRQWERAHGIKPPLTAEQTHNLESGRMHILNAQARARTLAHERAVASGLTVVKIIPERMEA